MTLFTAVMSDDERDELELTFSKGDKRHQLMEKLIRRKFDSFTNFVRLHCGENLVPGEETVDRISSAVSGSHAADEGTGDEAVTPEKPMKKKQQGATKKQKESKKREVAVVVAAKRSRVSPKMVKKKKVEEEEAEEEEKPDGKLSSEGVLVLMKLAMKSWNWQKRKWMFFL